MPAGFPAPRASFQSALALVRVALKRSTAFSLRLINLLRFCTPFPLRGPTTFGNLGAKWAAAPPPPPAATPEPARTAAVAESTAVPFAAALAA